MTTDHFCPPLAAGRRRLIDADQFTSRLKTPRSVGTTHLLLSPLELIEKRAALIPTPRFNLVRYHGLLAPNVHDRRRIVPAPARVHDRACAGGPFRL